MSASLVGSEMCIRDRQPLPPKGAGRLGPRAPIPKECGDCWIGGLRMSSTVSYTHLTLPTICSV
eukprot:3115263-Alexandrium_andersonii.AAC.1